MRKVLQYREPTADCRYIYPFFWPDEDHPEKIAGEVEAVYQSGCGGLCLEARPFEDFGGDSWWLTARTVLQEAKKRGLKVWILDDKHFPTGYANGYIKNKYPHLRRRWIYEHHADVYGTGKEISFRIPWVEDTDKVLGIFAYRRTGKDEELTGTALLPTRVIGDDFVFFDLPEGLWRVFTVIESDDPERDGRWHIDMLSRESAAVLIEAVYEKHYAHLKEYFGDPLEGFFSDEPTFSARHTERWGNADTFYRKTVGQPGMSLPWNDTVIRKMEEDGTDDIYSVLPLLWYEHTELSPAVRLSYMNAVTTLWNENFSRAVGDWCRSHGLIYTGHIIEDLNAHTALGASAGHYFRGLSGQDMAGIDIVLHQVNPGLSDYITAASVSSGIADGSFYHYTLGQLASSLSRITPRMEGKAMCELFGAYGWAEDASMMKWLADFLMIRGVNRFVPHAFSVKYPFEDCPPHFYAKGNSPQYKGFTAVMEHINRVTRLLDGTEKNTPGAIFYYAENDWMSGKDFMFGDVPAKLLYDNHIDYDILPLDALKEAEILDGKLYVNGHPHRFLVIPEAAHYPPELMRLTEKFTALGFPVFTLEEYPGHYGSCPGKSAGKAELIAAIRQEGLAFDFHLPASKLRIAEYDADRETVFYLFNEEPAEVFSGEITLPVTGAYSELRRLPDEQSGEETADGRITISLLPGEAAVLVFDGEKSPFPPKKECGRKEVLDILWDIAVKETGIDEDFRAYKTASPLFNITGAEGLPYFSGEIRYRGRFTAKAGSALLRIEEVGSTARMTLNGKPFAERVSKPYVWDVSDALQDGENEIEIIASNTLSHRVYDGFSLFLPLRPSGITGEIALLKEN